MDDFLREQEDNGQAHWVAQLSNGELIYQDDNRPGKYPESAWLRLKKYIEDNQLKIDNLWLRFRSNQVKCLPEKAEGYYFCKAAGGMLGSTLTVHCYMLGYLTKDKIVVYSYKVPELMPFVEDIREPETAKDCLIKN